MANGITATDVALIIGPLGSAVAAIIGALNRRTIRVTEKKTDDQTGKIAEVHDLANSALTRTTDRANQAESAVEDLTAKLAQSVQEQREKS